MEEKCEHPDEKITLLNADSSGATGRCECGAILNGTFPGMG